MSGFLATRFLHRRAPRKRGIQYAAASRLVNDVGDYWITRWSLSSGGALRQPDGG